MHDKCTDLADFDPNDLSRGTIMTPAMNEHRKLMLGWAVDMGIFLGLSEPRLPPFINHAAVLPPQSDSARQLAISLYLQPPFLRSCEQQRLYELALNLNRNVGGWSYEAMEDERAGKCQAINQKGYGSGSGKPCSNTAKGEHQMCGKHLTLCECEACDGERKAVRTQKRARFFGSGAGGAGEGE